MSPSLIFFSLSVTSWAAATFVQPSPALRKHGRAEQSTEVLEDVAEYIGEKPHKTKTFMPHDKANAVAQNVQKVTSPSSTIHSKMAAQPKAKTMSAPVSIPAPFDTDVEGFPKLPKISQMLLSASSTVKKLSTQAAALETRVVKAEKLSEAKMSKQKGIFENKLKKQEAENLVVKSENKRISADIADLTKINNGLKKRCKEIHATNHVMQMELRLIKAKLNLAAEFADKSMTKGIEKEHQGMSLLEISMDHTVASVDDVGSSVTTDGDLEDVSGDAVAQNTSDATPDSLLDVISKDVAAFKKQERESESSLRQFFVKDYRQGSKRHAALLLQQKELIASRSQLEEKRTELEKEETDRLEIRSLLEKRLHGLGDFLESLAHLAHAPVIKVPKMLKAMPKRVEI